jgi:predicted dehydrogenase
MEAEDFGAALVKFRNGAYGIIEGTVNVFPRNLEETLYLFGETGTVKAGGKSLDRIEVWDFAGGKNDEKSAMQDKQIRGHAALYADLLDALRMGREPLVTARDGRDALELVLAIYRSAWEGRPVKLPLQEGSTKDFIGRFS